MRQQKAKNSKALPKCLYGGEWDWRSWKLNINAFFKG
jgi:hypothetical protein